jgi:predicted double-glycine peptidase
MRFLLVLAAAAAIPAQSAAPVLDVPVVVQQKNGCGAAAVAMVIRYWRSQMPAFQADDDPAAVFERLYVPAEKGIRGADMARYFEQQGFRAFVIHADESDLSHHLSLGRPLIVCLRPKRAAPNHYVVVVGADASAGTISFVDPAKGVVVRQSASRFRDEWAPAENWTLLAVPQKSE